MMFAEWRVSTALLASPSYENDHSVLYRYSKFKPVDIHLHIYTILLLLAPVLFVGRIF